MTAVLVTGGAGYIGAHACKALAHSGYLPVSFDNLSQGHRWAVRWGPLEVGELAEVAAIRAALRRHRVQAVVHFAGSSSVGESTRDPAKYYRNNVVHALNLLEAMQAEGVKTIVFSSTAACYGLPLSVPIDEDHPANPVNPYGETKLAIERMLRWFGLVHGVRWLALRYFNAAGADAAGEIGEAHDPETHLIPLAIHAALRRRPGLEIFGTDYPTPDGTAIRDYVHVTDLARAHVAALRHLVAGGDSCVLNLGAGRGHSVREVVAAVESVAGVPVPVVERPRRAGDPPILVADPRRAAEILAWRTQTSGLSEIVASAWAWHTRLPNE